MAPTVTIHGLHRAGETPPVQDVVLEYEIPEVIAGIDSRDPLVQEVFTAGVAGGVTLVMNLLQPGLPAPEIQ